MVFTEGFQEEKEAARVDLSLGQQPYYNDLIEDHKPIQNDLEQDQIHKLPSRHKSKFKDISEFTITGKQLWDLKIDKIPHLVENLIPACGLSIIGGTGGIGKSAFCRQLATAVATEQQTFLGNGLNASSNKVVYVATEDGKSATSQIIRLQNPGTGEGLENVFFIYETDHIFEKLEACCDQLRPSLVVLDCLADLLGTGVDPNSSGNIRAVLAKYNQLAEKYNTAIVFIHHVNKNADKGSPKKNNLLGSVSWGDKVRLVTEFRVDPNDSSFVQVAIVKSNYLPHDVTDHVAVYQFKDMVFSETGQRLKKGSMGNKLQTADIIKLVCDTKVANPTLGSRSIAQLLRDKGVNVGKSTVAEILKQMIASVQDTNKSLDGQNKL